MLWSSRFKWVEFVVFAQVFSHTGGLLSQPASPKSDRLGNGETISAISQDRCCLLTRILRWIIF